MAVITGGKLLCHFDNGLTDAFGHTLTHSGTPSYATGVYSNGLVLINGQSAHVTSNDLILGTGDYTVDFRAKITSVNSINDGKFIGSSLWNTAGGIVVEVPIGTNNLRFFQPMQGGGAASYTYSASLNTWYHCAVVRYNSVTKYYINGSLVGTDSTTRDLTSDTFYIGGTVGETTSSPNGIIDELCIRNYAVWTSAFTPPTDAYSHTFQNSTLFFCMNI